MNIINKAKQFAIRKHTGQLDDSGKPFINHPVQVAEILKIITTDENLIAASYLHDVLEDTKTTYTELEQEFNKDIAGLVAEVSHEGFKNTGYYFPNLKTQRGIMLKFADRLSNLSRMEPWNEKRKAHYLKTSKFWKGG